MYAGRLPLLHRPTCLKGAVSVVGNDLCVAALICAVFMRRGTQARALRWCFEFVRYGFALAGAIRESPGYTKKQMPRASSLREKSVLAGNLPKIVHKKSALYASMMQIFMFLFPTKFLV